MTRRYGRLVIRTRKMSQPFFLSEPIFAVLFWMAFSARGVAEVAVGRRRRPGGQRSHLDYGSKSILVASQLIGLALGFGLAWCAPGMSARWQTIGLFTTGLACMAAGTALRISAIVTLGQFFTLEVAVQKSQPVVRTGSYRYVRHPAYAGSLLSLLGIGLALTNRSSLAVIVTVAFLAYSYRVRVEEQALIQTLGRPYLDYMGSTKKLIPGIY